jgi:nitrogen fixation/metabolism regulation signal transduction histidine kinase
MTNKQLFLIISLIITGILVYFLVLIHGMGNFYFLLGEGLIIMAIFFLILLYRRIIKPIGLLRSVSLLLKEKDFNTQLGHTGHPEMDAIVSTYNQMARNLREERLKQEEKHYLLNQLIEASPAGILILGFDGTILKSNHAARQLIDLPENTSKPLTELQHPLAKSLAQLKPMEQDVVHTHGIARYKILHGRFMDKGMDRSFYLIEELTHELLAAEKNSYETIIRTMSHEVNNTVGAVNSIMGTVSEQFPTESNFHRALETAIARSEHMNKFMANYARLVKLPIPHLSKFSLNQMFQRLCTLYQHNGQSNRIRFHLTPPDGEWMLKADELQMEQVFTNLLKNSTEAIEHDGDVFITINKANQSIMIEDTGKGISGHVKRKLFTPFVTDKKQGQGIGLMVVKEILLNHGFQFSLSSKEKRTTFTIWPGSALMHVPKI